MVGRNHFSEIKKDCILKKKKKNSSLRLNIVPYSEKSFFGSTTPGVEIASV